MDAVSTQGTFRTLAGTRKRAYDPSIGFAYGRLRESAVVHGKAWNPLHFGAGASTLNVS